MKSFYEYVAGQLGVRLPDTHTMLAMAGISLDTPDEEETRRLLNRARKGYPISPQPVGTRKANHRPSGGGVNSNPVGVAGLAGGRPPVPPTSRRP
jgi:hypothetical protein